MNKSIVLNICGIKSLGGLKVAKNAIKAINESQFELIILHDNNLSKISSEVGDFIEIETNLNRIFHPFLNIFLGRNEMKLINNANATIHLGNFGFKTNSKSCIMIQNILPLKKRNFKNIMLSYFVKKSFRQSDFIIYQLDHVAKLINGRFDKKLIGIGEIKKSPEETNTQVGIISILSRTENKNSSFIEKVLTEISYTIPDLKITKFNSEESREGTKSGKFLQSLSEHNIYFHASQYETVGLPLYEASSNGLFVVAPNRDYTNYFDSSNSAKYSENDVSSAVNQIIKIHEAKQRGYESLSYTENWNSVFEVI
jgi:hypothetical protein